jgi:hypothetical protein
VADGPTRDPMAPEEKSAWINAVLALGTLVAYPILFATLGIGFALPILLAIGGSIVLSILLHIALGIFAERSKPDVRDRDIDRFGERIGRWIVIAGALAALGLAMLQVDHGWIATAIFLGFAVGALLTCILKLVAYRRGLPSW